MYIINMNSILIIIIIGLAGLILSQRYIEKNYQFTDTQYYEVLKKKVLNKKDDLPIMWVYIPQRYNARSWCSFGSRGTFDLNQPYLNLTIKSIIKMCDKSFKVCFNLPFKVCFNLPFKVCFNLHTKYVLIYT